MLVNDHLIRVQGIAAALPRFPPRPLLYVTRANAARIRPAERHTLTFVMASASHGIVGLPRYRYDLEPLRATRPLPAARPAAPGSSDAGAPGSPTPAAGAVPALPSNARVAPGPGGVGVGAVPPLLARLPAHLGTRLTALKAEDHYILVHTEAGKALVLYRLSDAINELQALRGLRVHRSYWVNLNAVTGTEVTARGCCALIKNGLRVPISASYREAARAAGLLAG